MKLKFNTDMKKIYLLLSLLVVSSHSFSQSDNDSIPSNGSFPTIVDKYDQLIDDGSTYQEYNMIKKKNVKSFRDEILASKDSLENIIDQQKSKQNELNKNIENLEEELAETKQSLDQLREKTDSIAFFGMQLEKTVYHIIVWSIIGILAIVSVLLFINFRKSNMITKATKESMNNLEVEYEEYRRNAIEKQQQQGRKILDLQKSVKKKPGGNTGPKKNT